MSMGINLYLKLFYVINIVYFLYFLTFLPPSLLKISFRKNSQKFDNLSSDFYANHIIF